MAIPKPLRPSIYRFGPFEADVAKSELRKGRVKIRLERKPWQLLLALLERPGETVSRAEIERRLWPEGVFVDFEHGVNVAVKKLRQALLDSAAESRYIETVPGEGYRFIAKLADLPTAAQPAPQVPVVMPATPRRLVWPLTGFLAVLAVAASLQWSRDTLRQTAPAVKVTRLLTNGEAHVSAGTSLSPDAKYAAYQLDEPGKRSIWVRQLASGSAIRVAEVTPNRLGSTTFSHDGNFLYYHDGPVIMMVPTIGGESRKVVNGVTGPVCVSPDGRSLAFIRNLDAARNLLMLADADGANERVLAERRRPVDWFMPYGCSWSPDSKRIAVGGGSTRGGRGYNTLLAVDVQRRTIAQVGEERDFVGRVNWPADGSAIFFEGSDEGEPTQLYEISFPNGKARRLTGDMTTAYSNASTVLADDGKTAVAVRLVTQSKLWIVPAKEPSAARPFPSAAGAVGLGGIASAPDGRLMFGSTASGGKAIWIVRPERGSEPRQVTRDELSGEHPQITPDGRYFIFVGKNGSHNVLYRAALDGSGLKPLSSGSSAVSPVLTPDGRWAFYGTTEGEGWALWKVNLDSAKAERVTSGQIWPLGFTPDGKRLVALSLPSRSEPSHAGLLSPETGAELERVTLPDSALRAADRGILPRLTPDGASISYPDLRDGVEDIWVQPLHGGTARKVTSFQSRLMIFGFTWSQSGDLFVARGTQTADAVLMRSLR